MHVGSKQQWKCLLSHYITVGLKHHFSISNVALRSKRMFLLEGSVFPCYSLPDGLHITQKFWQETASILSLSYTHAHTHAPIFCAINYRCMSCHVVTYPGVWIICSLCIYIYKWEHGSSVIQAPCYKPEGRGLETLWDECIFLSLPNPSRQRPDRFRNDELLPLISDHNFIPYRNLKMRLPERSR
jgi:hypothetical protein